MNENAQGLALEEKTSLPILENGEAATGNYHLLPAKNQLISKQISSKDLIAEEKFLIEKETEVEKNYRGFGGYLRLFRVSKVIGNRARTRKTRRKRCF